MTHEQKARVGAIGRILRAVRLSRGLSQDKIAKAGGISRPEVSIVEHGRHALTSGPMRTSIAAAMGIHPSVVDMMVESPQIPVSAVADALGVDPTLVVRAIEDGAPRKDRAPRRPSFAQEAARPTAARRHSRTGF